MNLLGNDRARIIVRHDHIRADVHTVPRLDRHTRAEIDGVPLHNLLDESLRHICLRLAERGRVGEARARGVMVELVVVVLNAPEARGRCGGGRCEPVPPSWLERRRRRAREHGRGGGG